MRHFGLFTAAPLVAVGLGHDLVDRDARWTQDNGRFVATPAASEDAVASYTVQPDEAGFYVIKDSVLQRASAQQGRVALRVYVQRGGSEVDPAVTTVLDAGESFDFDTFLGYLDAGDKVFVSLGADGDASGDATAIDFKVAQAPAIEVSRFSEDAGNPRALEAPGGWSVASGVEDSAAARRLAWDDAARHADKLKIAGGQTVVSFRAPQSGHYAMHDAVATSEASGVEARLYVGDESAPRRVVAVSGQTSIASDLGYVRQGDMVHVAFTAGGEASVAFDATMVEWAPRRAPLRVRRGEDGYLDVYAPEAPRTAIDIPRGRWLQLPAVRGDATAALRAAFEKVRTTGADGWRGIRLEAGATYVIGSDMESGTLFELSDISRVVLDGNGATLLVASPEIQRRGFNLFVTNRGANNLVFADMTVDSTHVPFTVGRIIDLNPKTGNTQTLTVQMEPGSVHPLQEISRNGQSSAYLYDPNIPGRLGFGTWSHYPNFRDGPGIQAAGKPGVFTHQVTRTNSSINVGDKWLVKNKGGGLIYLTTRGDSHNITISGIDGRASGGGTLRFWSTSAINVLDSRFEPKDNYWISSSADGIHGRGREGVWIEDTVIRGVCEDIMNTYGRTMIVKPDDNLNDNVMTLGVYDSAVRSGRTPPKTVEADDVRVGDRLVFFAPQTGKVLAYAQVLKREGETVTLSQSVEGVVLMTQPGARDITVVYSADSVGNFVVRDSKFMDSMRIGIYVKAKGGVVFNNTIEGQSAPGVFAVNEPEWPEGPPATHLWVQGNTFSQNNYGYMSRNRDFLVVDPADVTVYTRRFRQPGEPDNHHAFVTRGQHANSHVKVIANTFHDWRGMGVAVRNARNVFIEDNLFLPPAVDGEMRKTMQEDPALSRGGRGGFAAIFMDTVGGGRVTGNRFLGLPDGDQAIATDQDVTDLVDTGNDAAALGEKPDVAITFSEWFGGKAGEERSVGAAVDQVDLRGNEHKAGRLGAGVFFNGEGDPAVLKASRDAGGRPAAQLSLALWAHPQGDGDTQVLFHQGDAKHGLVIAIDRGRFVAGLWQGEQGAWLDLGPAAPRVWQHVAVVFDGAAGSLAGYVNGFRVASHGENLPATLPPMTGDAGIGGVLGTAKLGGDRTLSARSAAYTGGIDELRIYSRAIHDADLAQLVLRQVARD